ncbi:hypothetical protein IEU95_06980 [Hoyosella rhizosphaerae]|uniref:Uncharacterized protein n=1 Tax=Hoyosella rhizosphaerae TaxID=1755582 RepID=A0A916U2P9_9ACTN|nr:hypothetical protein [Hoyosella rhizosphaerae]MBN4926565.1 hypothetical protein [Hoyosella rhizosphaerae]GGC58249.1 hypothetical protein GCM10011410_08430 [Hoyosella rhizosphaerae]
MTDPQFSSGAMGQPLMPDAMRKQYLSLAIANEVSRGGRVEWQSEFEAILVVGKPTNHVLHLLITVLGGVFTCGLLLLWVFVWLVIALSNKEKRVRVGIDEYGHTHRQWIS